MIRLSPIEQADGIRAIFTLPEPCAANSLIPFLNDVQQSNTSVRSLSPLHIAHVTGVTEDALWNTNGTLYAPGHAFTTGALVAMQSETLPSPLTPIDAYVLDVVDVDTVAIHNLTPYSPETAPACVLIELDPVLSNVVIEYAANRDQSPLWTADAYIRFFSVTPTTVRVPDDAELREKVQTCLVFATNYVREYLRFHAASQQLLDAITECVYDGSAMPVVKYAIGLIATKLLLEEQTALDAGIVTERIEKLTTAIQVTNRYQGYGADNITSIFKQSIQDILNLLLRECIAGTSIVQRTLPMMRSHALDSTHTTRSDILLRP